MKLRLGFITNSSSTNFIIAWNGNKNDIVCLLNKHIELFPKFPPPFIDKKKDYQENEFGQKIVDQILSIVNLRITRTNKYIRKIKIAIRDMQDCLSELKDPDILEKYNETIDIFNEACEALSNKKYAINIRFGNDNADFKEDTGVAMFCGSGPHFYNDNDLLIVNAGEKLE